MILDQTNETVQSLYHHHALHIPSRVSSHALHIPFTIPSYFRPIPVRFSSAQVRAPHAHMLQIQSDSSRNLVGTNKYGSVSAAMNETKYYYQIVRAEVARTGISERIPAVKFIVDENFIICE